MHHFTPFTAADSLLNFQYITWRKDEMVLSASKAGMKDNTPENCRGGDTTLPRLGQSR